MKNYFIINECDVDLINIGIVIAETSEELTEKATQLCIWHFDADMTMEQIDIEHVCNTHCGVLLHKITIAGEEFTRQIEIIKAYVI